MTAKRIVEICPAAMADLRSLLPRRMSRLALMRLVLKLEYWKTGEDCALDAPILACYKNSVHELLIEETFGFSHGMRIAFCEGDELSPESKIYLIGMRREDEPLTHAMIEVLRLRREMLTN